MLDFVRENLFKLRLTPEEEEAIQKRLEREREDRVRRRRPYSLAGVARALLLRWARGEIED